MRPIKFRAWGIKSGVMVDVAELLWTVGGLRAHGPGCYIEGGYMDGDEVKDDNIVLMQFTGLLDKNGKEIYEGDILMLNLPPKRIFRASVCWQETLGFWDCRWKDGGITGKAYSLSKAIRKTKLHEGYLEVIGNLFENQELLKEKQ